MKIVLNIKRNSDWPTTREVMGFIYIQENLSHLKHNTIPSTPSPLTTVLSFYLPPLTLKKKKKKKDWLKDRTVDILRELGSKQKGPEGFLYKIYQYSLFVKISCDLCTFLYV